jgi:type II secretory pathway predicted ATPase ExeA
MYEEFFGYFGLERNPFHVSPNPLGFFSTAAHDEALSQLVFGIEARKGMMVLTGEPGTGKSTILHYLLEWLQRHNYSTAYVFSSSLAFVDLLQLILRDFGISCSSASKGALRITLRRWLEERHKVGDCPVILIDEAQVLSTRALDDLRKLLNMEIAGTKLVQVVLAGQPLLEQKLRRQKLAQLRQCIMCRCKLPVLTLRETSGYIATRLAGAGLENSTLFPKETVQEIFLYSHGVPRVVNLLCEHALLTAYADRRTSIAPDDILQVARHFDLGGETELARGAFQSNTFCRLIPFPKLGAPVAKARPGEEEKRPLSGETTIASVPPALSPSAPEETAEALALQTGSPAALIIRSKWRFSPYCRAVGKSFGRDCRAFLGRCTAWLRGRPRATAGRSTVSLGKLVLSLSNWFRRPLGSSRIAADPPRVSPAVQKHI